MNKEPAKSGDEQDWISLKSRRLLATFGIGSGKGRAVKRALNKRWRQRWKRTRSKDADAEDSPPLHRE